MITPLQAIVAMESTAPVFGPDGDEMTVVRVHGSHPSVITVDSNGRRDVYGFNELDPSRDLIALTPKEN